MKSDGRGHRAGESGQTTIFVMASFLTLFLFFALVANVGQAVNRRVMLQMAADAGAFTGASAQASGLNMISYYNGLIKKSWTATQILMLGFTVQVCGVDEIITRAYQVIQKALSVTIKVANHGGAAWALMEAEEVTRQNLQQLFPDGSAKTPIQSLGLSFSSFRSLKGTAGHLHNMNRAWPELFDDFALVDLEEGSVTKRWVCFTKHSVHRKSRKFKLWFEKDDEDEVTRFYWWVTTEEVPALVMPDLFGTIPAMTAVALAKPIGGDIAPKGNGPVYVAKLIPVSTLGDTMWSSLTIGRGIEH
jgi:hypothetical protein